MQSGAREGDIADTTDSYSSSSNVVRLGGQANREAALPVHFNRRELDRILRVYSFMVAGGEWRDYAIDALSDRAVFSIFRRASEMPLYRIEKNPKLARRQGEWAVIGASGQVLKRGHDLEQVLRLFDRQLKLVTSR